MMAKPVEAGWLGAMLESVARVDPEAVGFVQRQGVRVLFSRQGSHVSAIWTPGMRIVLNTRYFSADTPVDDPHLMGIVMHEIRHLQQGYFTALSVYGELDAWQFGFRVEHGLLGRAYPANLVELMSLPVVFDRNVLQRARELMLLYAGKKYRADLLPLYPWGREIMYRLGR